MKNNSKNRPIIKIFNTFKKSKYKEILKLSFKNSLLYESNISKWILNISGMSGIKYRHFINNIIYYLDDARYLEVGCWTGSTTCAAISNNIITSYVIDNWSEFGGPKKLFLDNVQKCKSESKDIKLFFNEIDFRKIDYSKIGKFNVYFFDGPHKEKDQYDSLALVHSALDDEFIFICDDWNWKQVRDGTNNAIIDLKLDILHRIEIRTDNLENHSYSFSDVNWHNGYCVFILKK